jgi:hypothetical protein
MSVTHIVDILGRKGVRGLSTCVPDGYTERAYAHTRAMMNLNS